MSWLNSTHAWRLWRTTQCLRMRCTTGVKSSMTMAERGLFLQCCQQNNRLTYMYVTCKQPACIIWNNHLPRHTKRYKFRQRLWLCRSMGKRRCLLCWRNHIFPALDGCFREAARAPRWSVRESRGSPSPRSKQTTIKLTQRSFSKRM